MLVMLAGKDVETRFLHPSKHRYGMVWKVSFVGKVTVVRDVQPEKCSLSLKVASDAGRTISSREVQEANAARPMVVMLSDRTRDSSPEQFEKA